MVKKCKVGKKAQDDEEDKFICSSDSDDSEWSFYDPIISYQIDF